MTVVRVTSLEGALNPEEREKLADLLTSAVLEVETGNDTAEARAGVMVVFEEIGRRSWYHGGRSVEDLYPPRGIFWLTATVMQGPWTRRLRSDLIGRLSGALRSALELPDRRAVWITLREVPDGSWGVNGRVLGIEQLLWAFEPDRQETIRRFLGRS